MSVASSTGLNKSFDNSITIFSVVEPSTFLTPISLVRLVAVNEASPNKPKQAMNIARAEKILIPNPGNSLSGRAVD